jgi:hypothetical protein
VRCVAPCSLFGFSMKSSRICVYITRSVEVSSLPKMVVWVLGLLAFVQTISLRFYEAR